MTEQRTWTPLERRLAADLRERAGHLHWCAAWAPEVGGRPRVHKRPMLPERCNCGLVEVLTRANEVEAP